ncbi:hypothetical protein SLS56_001054 [Neofusicoccum ribis]|uniref:Uncharacterized protein n=1 Tax=Neofusicoccum ribis TaxID=45134 RepID=A0ABR3TA96_9PEZI
MRSPSSLLHLDFDLTADPATQSVRKLDVLSISPWATHELGAWVTQRAAENDVGGVCWAAESYYDLAIKRAKCWARCFREFGRLLNDDTEAKVANSSTKKTNKRKGVQQDMPTSSNLLEDEAEEVSGIGNDLTTTKEQNERPITRSELLRGLGRDHIILRSKEVLFRISWIVQFDWTGEAESMIRADVALPSVWREADDRGSLMKIPAAFDRLVAEMGVFESIKAMVGLLYA